MSIYDRCPCDPQSVHTYIDTGNGILECENCGQEIAA